MMPEYTPDKVSVQELKALGKHLSGLEEGSSISLVKLPLNSNNQARRALDYFVIRGAVSHLHNSPYVLSNKSKLAEIRAGGYREPESSLSAALARVEADMPSCQEIYDSRFDHSYGSREAVVRSEKLRARAKVGLVKIMFRNPEGIARDEIMKVHTRRGSDARRGDIYDRDALSFYNDSLGTLETNKLIIVDHVESDDVPTLFPNGSDRIKLNTENEEGIIALIENYRRMQ